MFFSKWHQFWLSCCCTFTWGIGGTSSFDLPSSRRATDLDLNLQYAGSSHSHFPYCILIPSSYNINQKKHHLQRQLGGWSQSYPRQILRRRNWAVRNVRSLVASTTVFPMARRAPMSLIAWAIFGPPCCGPWIHRPWKISCALICKDYMHVRCVTFVVWIDVATKMFVVIILRFVSNILVSFRYMSRIYYWLLLSWRILKTSRRLLPDWSWNGWAYVFFHHIDLGDWIWDSLCCQTTPLTSRIKLDVPHGWISSDRWMYWIGGLWFQSTTVWIGREH